MLVEDSQLNTYLKDINPNTADGIANNNDLFILNIVIQLLTLSTYFINISYNPFIKKTISI